MLKKIIALCLALACCLSTALAWSCPGCGQEMNGKFCTECGTKKPENTCPNCGTDFGDSLPKFCTECGTKLTETAAATATPAPTEDLISKALGGLKTPEPTATPVATAAPETAGVTILGVEASGKGTHTVTWQDNGKGPYAVYFCERFSNSLKTDRSDMRGTGYWTDQTDIAGTSHTMQYLVPGKAYWIIVADSAGNESCCVYQAPAAEASDLNASVVYCWPCHAENDEYTPLSVLSAATLESEYTGNYGVSMEVTYVDFADDQVRLTQWVLTLPDGVAYVSDQFDMTWFAGGDMYWDCFKLDWDFGVVKRWYNKVLQGEYRLDCYADGAYVFSVTFTVGE